MATFQDDFSRAEDSAAASVAGFRLTSGSSVNTVVTPPRRHIEHVGATATSHPCQLYAHTGIPRPSRTQGHHRHPEYLQDRLWGQVRDRQLLWLCGLCHDSIHDYLGWLLSESRKPDPLPSPRAQREAQLAAEWYWREGGK